MTTSSMRDWSEAATRPNDQPFDELATVGLVHAVAVDDRSLPAGTRGTVVGVYRGSAAYEVEFDQPFHAIVTLTRVDLAA